MPKVDTDNIQFSYQDPDESLDWELDLSSIPSYATDPISTAVVTITSKPGSPPDVNPLVLDTTKLVNGKQVNSDNIVVWLKNGDVGTAYNIEFLVTTVNGRIYDYMFRIYITDNAFLTR